MIIPKTLQTPRPPPTHANQQQTPTTPNPPPTHANQPTTTSSPPTPPTQHANQPPTPRPPNTRQTPPPPGYPKRYLRPLNALVKAASNSTTLDQALIDLATRVRKSTFFEYRRAVVIYLQMTNQPSRAAQFAKIQRPEAARLDGPKKKKRRTIEIKTVQTLFKAAADRKDYSLVLALELGWKYGLRLAEFAGVEVRENRLEITSAKRTSRRGSNRAIALTDDDAERLGRSIAKLKAENPEALRMRLYRLSKELYPRRQPVTFHRVRHQVASDLKAQGVEIAEIAKLLGHRSCQSTQGYGDPRRGKGSPARRKLDVKAEHQPKPLKSSPPAARGGPVMEGR